MQQTMALLTLRDEFGDVVRWKVILIVELLLLVVVGCLVLPQVVSDLFRQQGNGQTTTGPVIRPRPPASVPAGGWVPLLPSARIPAGPLPQFGVHTGHHRSEIG